MVRLILFLAMATQCFAQQPYLMHRRDKSRPRGSSIPVLPTNNLVFSIEAWRLATSDGTAITVWQCPYTGELATNIGTLTKETIRGKPVMRFGAGGILNTSNTLLNAAMDTALSVYVAIAQTNDTLKVIGSRGGASEYIASGNVNEGDGSLYQRNVAFNFSALGFNTVTANGELTSLRYDGANFYRRAANGAVTTTADTDSIGWNGHLTIGDLSSGGGFNYNGYLEAMYFYKESHDDTEADAVNDWVRYNALGFAPDVCVFPGNSLVAGTGGLKLTTPWRTNYLARFEAGRLSQLYNEAVSGQTVSNMYREFGTQVGNKIYTKSMSTNQTVFLLFPATNDHASGYTTNDIKNWLTNFATLVHSNNAYIHISDDIARDGFTADQNTAKTTINMFISNSWASGLWFDKFTTVAKRFTNPLGADYTDGTHLTPAATREAQDLVATNQFGL